MVIVEVTVVSGVVVVAEVVAQIVVEVVFMIALVANAPIHIYTVADLQKIIDNFYHACEQFVFSMSIKEFVLLPAISQHRHLSTLIT